MAVSVDHDDADEILREFWKEVLEKGEQDYIEDEGVKEQIRVIVEDDSYGQKTYRYMLFTNILAKATDPRIHYRALQVDDCDLQEAFDSRSLAEDRVVNWEKENGQRLGGSNEPGTNNPYRHPSVSLETNPMHQHSLERLYELLQELEDKTESGELDPKNVLKQTLYFVSELPSQTVDYVSPSEVPYSELRPKVNDYLEISGGGERLASVSAGITLAYYFYAGTDGDLEVNADHVNVPDEQSNAAGDVEVKQDGELVRAIEVKDKPVGVNDVKHAIHKARSAELGEYLFFVGDGFKNGKKADAIAEAENAPIEMILVYPDEYLGQLKFVGESGRRKFVDEVGEFLNDMRAQEESKDGWKELVESFED
ncbi:restriction endonuclease, SacI family [Haloarcula rubripromontorii]|uniref:restriction endonuclease, SacI family n=1 Tax=Haloarcula rubripromontorii TaxID=1705562 RepID=UPI00345B805C